jgi:hypothetical protein
MLRKQALPVSFPDRKFHVGNVGGTHGELLFRSGTTGYHRGTRIYRDSVVDIQFKNVAAIAVADGYFSLEIAYATSEEAERFLDLLGCDIGDRQIYRLHGDGVSGFIAAGSLYWVDDPEGSVHEPSVLSSGYEPKHVDVFTDEYR